jgi:hypothetical protein
MKLSLSPSPLRFWVAGLFAVAGLALLPWTVWLSSSLPAHHDTSRWDLAWSGFDSGLALMFLLTALAAWRRSPWLEACAAATGTLLVTDAWFDVILESHADEMRLAILLAAVAELPAAAFCFWIAYRTEHFLSLLVGATSHLPATRERTAERDLVRVLEVTADGEPAREASHSDTTS